MTSHLPTTCPNCKHQVEGHFCAYCGQRHEPVRLTFGSLSGSLLSTLIGDNIAGIKGHTARYGIFYTLQMLFRHPGRLIGEYLSGKRIKYFDPVTLLLLLSTVYALLAALLDMDTPLTIDDSDSDTEISEVLAILSSIFTYFRNTPWLWHLTQLPFMALAFRLLFRRNRYRMRYMEYFYVGIFISTLMLVIALFRLPVDAYGTMWMKSASPWITMAIKGVFMILLFRHLYRVGWLRAAWCFLFAQVVTLAGALLSTCVALFAYLLIYFLIHDGF